MTAVPTVCPDCQGTMTEGALRAPRAYLTPMMWMNGPVQTGLLGLPKVTGPLIRVAAMRCDTCFAIRLYAPDA